MSDFTSISGLWTRASKKDGSKYLGSPPLKEAITIPVGASIIVKHFPAKKTENSPDYGLSYVIFNAQPEQTGSFIQETPKPINEQPDAETPF